MSNYQKNIDLRDNGLAKRLRVLRESVNLTQSDLAEKAGLSYRTVHDLELGKRQRCQEKTLMLLAQALDTSLDKLLGYSEARQTSSAHPRELPNKQALLTGVVVLVVLVGAAAALLWHHSCTNAIWTLDQGQLEVHDEILGIRLWGMGGNDEPYSGCMVSPWNSRHLLVAASRRAPGGGAMHCVERATGDTVWTVRPDIGALVRAFGSEVIGASRFSCQKNMFVANLDGDDTPEIVASFSHGKYYPVAICIIQADGRLRAQYSHKGHVYGLMVVDIDADNRDEIIVTGVNNNKAYMGATVFMLDDQHCNGASVDSLCQPWSSEPDSALYRVILPNYPAPYMEAMRSIRLSAYNPQICDNGAGDIMVSAVVRGNDPRGAVTVFFDAELRPLRAEADDSMLSRIIPDWPDSLTRDAGPGDPTWLSGWVAGHKRFQVGHLVSER